MEMKTAWKIILALAGVGAALQAAKGANSLHRFFDLVLWLYMIWGAAPYLACLAMALLFNPRMALWAAAPALAVDAALFVGVWLSGKSYADMGGFVLIPFLLLIVVLPLGAGIGVFVTRPQGQPPRKKKRRR